MPRAARLPKLDPPAAPAEDRLRPLGALIEGLAAARVDGDLATPVARVRADSRLVEAGDVFVAIRGARSDGHAHLAQALARGAAVLVVAGDAATPTGARAVVRVPDTARALGHLAAAAAGWPARRLALVGLTGTNGKTTTSYLLEAILAEAGARPGVIGTVETRLGSDRRAATLTTPDAPALQQLLAEMADSGATHVVLEVSSIALDQARVAGCEFAVAVFTNLTQDHLDYHGDLDSYFEAKRQLFLARGPAGAPRRAVVNVDDPRGRELARSCDSPVTTYGTGLRADVQPSTFVLTRAGIRTRVDTPQGDVDVSSQLVGRHNLENLLAAVAAATALGVPRDAIERGLRRQGRVPGRLERVAASGDVDVFVDYAHTPDALARVLDAARSLTARRLVTVFGCGGDRDRAKRPLMAAAALRASDVVVVTSDNPRSEDPERIVADVVAGLAEGRRIAPEEIGPAAAGSYAVIVDRREAIRAAVQGARPGDVVVIAGKGHEDYQLVGREKRPFDDRLEAASALAERLR